MGSARLAPRRGVVLSRNAGSGESQRYQEVKRQFTLAGFTVEQSGPNDHGDYLVSTRKLDRVGPSGIGLTPELAISNAWIRYDIDRRTYD